MGSRRRGKNKQVVSTRMKRGMTGAERADQQLVDQTVSAEAQQHGGYQAIDFKLVEVVEGGKLQARVAKVVRNRGGTPLDRWHANGGLDDRQMAALLVYSQAWEKMWSLPRVVANWSMVHSRDAGPAVELYTGSVIAARNTLRLIDNEIFFKFDPGYFSTFQNVVIFEEPAGVAGGRAGYTHKAAEGAAKAIVAMFSSMIADLVIDGSRSDYDLPEGWDVNAPRKVLNVKRRAA